MKKLDSYRLLDIILNSVFAGGTLIITFMVSLGYNQISRYFAEIKDFPYFIAFLPAFLSSVTHGIIDFFGAKRHGYHLIDLSKKATTRRENLNSVYITLIGAVFSLILIVLQLAGVWQSEEYLYVLSCFPMGLAPAANFLYISMRAMLESKSRHKVLKAIAIFLVPAIPIGLALGTYLPGVWGWSYVGMAFLPISYLIGDSLSMDKETSDISEGNDF